MTTAMDEPTSDLGLIPKARLVALYVLAVTLGLVPFALTIQSWQFLVLSALTCTVVTAVCTRAIAQYSGQTPAATEIALGLLGSSFSGVISGLFGIAFFILIRFASALYDWLFFSVPLSSWTPETVPTATWAKYASLLVPEVIVWFFVAAICTEDASKFFRKLYPNLSGQASPYFALSLQPRYLWSLLIQAVICILAISLAVSFPYIGQLIRPLSGLAAELIPYLGSIVGLFLLSAYWLTFTQDLWDTKSPDLPRVRNQPLVRRIQGLMEAAGYQVRIYPQTGDDEADPLIALLDFVAIRSDRSMAGQIKDYMDIALTRRDLESLRPAVWALEDQLSKNRSSRKIVLEPVLFLTSRASRAPADVSDLVNRIPVRIVNIAETDLDELESGKDGVGKADRAKQLVDPADVKPAPPPAAGLATI